MHSRVPVAQAFCLLLICWNTNMEVYLELAGILKKQNRGKLPDQNLIHNICLQGIVSCHAGFSSTPVWSRVNAFQDLLSSIVLIKTVKILFLFQQMCLYSCRKPFEFPVTFEISGRVCTWSCLSRSPPLHENSSASRLIGFIHQFGQHPWRGPLVCKERVILTPICLVRL